MAAWQSWVIVGSLLFLAPCSYGQNYAITETPKTGENYRITMETTLSGVMRLKPSDRKADLKLVAKNEHVVLERVLTVEKGLVRKSARHYEKATSTASVGEDRNTRTLREDRRLFVAQRLDDSLFCYNPAGPLTRQEVEITSEHFDTLFLPGLLPEKEVAIEDTWKISNGVAQAVCLFEGLIAQDLVGKLRDVKDGSAIITIQGKAEGIEMGAKVKLEIDATLRYDLLKHRIISLEWKQKDQRDQGPASPATEVETTTTMTRELLAEEPKELNKTALASVPSEDDPPGLLKQLVYNDTKGRFNFVYSRGWHIVGQTDTHVVLRLLDRGDFVAQATLTVWKNAEPGKSIEPEEFRKAVATTPGWDMQEIVEQGNVPTDEGRKLYRIAARGELDGVKVVQNFYALTGPTGHQMIMTVTMKPTAVGNIGTRDLALINAVDFPKK